MDAYPRLDDDGGGEWYFANPSLQVEGHHKLWWQMQTFRCTIQSSG